MRIRRPCLALVILLIPAVAHADDHFADLFGGISRARASSLWGFHEAFALTAGEYEHWSVIVGDLGVHLGSHEATDVTQITVLSGLRYSPVRVRDRHMPFVQALIGAVSTTTVGAERNTNIAAAIGAGWEVGLGEGIQSRGHRSTTWAIRAQADYIFHDGSDLIRVSAGFVRRFRKPQP